MAFAANFYLGDVLGPAGTAGMASLANDVTKRTLVDVAGRLLSWREQERVTTAFHHAVERIKYNRDAGYTFRDDGFFETDATGRSDADEILEAVLLKARNETEERKAEYLGNIFGNLAFRADVPKTVANFCIRTAEILSFQQLCFLALVAKDGSLDVESLRRREHRIPDLEVLKREEMSLHTTDLGTLGLIKGIGSWIDELSDLGEALHDLASLSEIPEEDLMALRKKLRSCDKSRENQG